MRPLDCKRQPIHVGDTVLVAAGTVMYKAQVTSIGFCSSSNIKKIMVTTVCNDVFALRSPELLLVVTKQLEHFRNEYPELLL